MRKIIILLFIAGSMAFAQRIEMTKNGIEFKDDLINRLGISDTNSVEKLFLSLRQNLPKQNTIASLSGGLDSMAKLSIEACTQASYFEDEPWSDVNGLYVKLFDRHATPEELKSAVRDSKNKLSYLANCFELTMRPEFLFRRN